MNILCHRGRWSRQDEKNTLLALLGALVRGLGVETDVRDYRGELVVSHDPPVGREITLEELLEEYSRMNSSVTLALNVKADGIGGLLKSQLAKHGISNYFVFDMSAPEAYQYVRTEMSLFTRQSEFEPMPIFEKEAKGIWLDAFLDEWYSLDVIKRGIDAGKKVAIVSPELHGRDHDSLWSKIRTMDNAYLGELYLCTDMPDEAIEYFNGN